MQPIVVMDLFPDVSDKLLELLSTLTPDEWMRPTTNPKWSVKDIVAHLLGNDLGRLSRHRDQFSWSLIQVNDWDGFVSLLNQQNEGWVEATRRLSSRVLCDLLAFTSRQVYAYLGTLDSSALGMPVNWAGPDPAPIWLDIAREFTENWTHQQHIRDAVGRPGLAEARYMKPVLETFVQALPHTYRRTDAPEGTRVKLSIEGEAGGVWSILRQESRWSFCDDLPSRPDAEVSVSQEDAWRMFTRTISKEEAANRIAVAGGKELGRVVLDMVSVIA